METKWQSPPGELGESGTALYVEAPLDLRRSRRRWLAAVLTTFAAALWLVVWQVDTVAPRSTCSFGNVTEYARIRIEVEGNAYIALEHRSLKVENPAILEARSSQETLNEIVIRGLRPGVSKIAVEFDVAKYYQLDVTVLEKQEWPPRWTDDDRLRAAEKLLREAYSLYESRETVTEAMVPAHYRFAKVVRLYENCKFYPPVQYTRARDCRDELGAKITEMEKNLTRSFWRNFRQNDFAAAHMNLDDLLVLFPADGSDEDPLAQHGSREKHHKYFLLGQQLAQVEVAGKRR